MITRDRKIIYIVVGMILFALFFGIICRVTVLAADAPESDPVSTSETTTEDHLSEEELEHILNVSKQFLENNEFPEMATSTDADFDTNPYLTFGLDQEWIDKDTSVNSALNDIYRMVLSIRNVLVVIACLLVAFWFDKKLHAIINKLFGGR